MDDARELAVPIIIGIAVVAIMALIVTTMQVEARHYTERMEACTKARGTYVRISGSDLCLVNKGLLQ